MDRKGFTFVCPFAIVAVFGLLYCARVGYLTLTDRLVCASDTCVALQQTAIAKPFGIPIAFFGVGFYACVLLLLARSRAPQTKTLQAVAGVGALAGVGLLAYGWVIAGSFCPWCTVSTATTLCLLAAASTYSPPRPMSFWGTMAALSVSALMVGGAEWGIRRSMGADGEYLRTLAFSRLLAPTHHVYPAETRAEIETAVFVNLECHSCRRTLREMLDRSDPFALHFAGGSGEYGHPAAVAILSAEMPRDRARLLSRLLANGAADPESLARLISSGEGSSKSAAESAYRGDVALSRKLKIRGLPAVFVRADGLGGPYWRTADAP